MIFRGRRPRIVASPRRLRDDEASEVPQACEVLGPGPLVTIQERTFGLFDPVRKRLQKLLREGVGAIRRLGPGTRGTALLKTLVFHYPSNVRLRANDVMNGSILMASTCIRLTSGPGMPLLYRTRGRVGSGRAER